MQQYFIDSATKVHEKIEMNQEQSHHITHVMRMKPGTCIRIADVNAHLYDAVLAFTDGKVMATITDQRIDLSKNPVKITLAQGMIKGEKWDYLLQKSAELGVDCIVPFISSRCMVKSKEEKLDKKMKRWNKILLEACEQCKRSTQVHLFEPCSHVSLGAYKSALNIIAYEDADVKSERLCDVLRQHPTVESVTIIVGSEGGFSNEEVDALVAQGYIRVSLGARILRAETAAISLMNSISFYYDMVGEKE